MSGTDKKTLLKSELPSLLASLAELQKESNPCATTRNTASELVSKLIVFHPSRVADCVEKGLVKTSDINLCDILRQLHQNLSETTVEDKLNQISVV